MGLSFNSISNKVKDVYTGKAVASAAGIDTDEGLLDFVPGYGDAKAAEKANKANLAESALNRAFQERMSSTAYQRAMEDMRKAGLNPTLAYMQGGASAPSGSQATVQSASKSGVGEFALRSLTGIGGLKQQQTALEQQKTMNESAILLNSANSAKANAEAERARVETRIKKKDEPAAGIKYDISNEISKGIRSFMKRFQTNAENPNSEAVKKRQEYIHKQFQKMKGVH